MSVKDKSGKVLPGLTKNDFEVLEDGKPQQVSVFEFQQLDSDDIERKPVPAVKSPAAAQPAEAAARAIRSALGSAAPGHPFPGPPAGRDAVRFQHHGDSRAIARAAVGARVSAKANKAGRPGLHHDREHRAARRSFRTSRTTAIVWKRSSRGFQIGVASELSALGSNGDTTTGEDTGTAFDADETEFKSSTRTANWRRWNPRRKCSGRFPEKKALLYFSSGISKSDSITRLA